MVATEQRPLRVTAFFGDMAAQFVAGRLDEVAQPWTFPCPVEIGGQLVVMRNAEAFEAHLAERRTALMGEGLTALTPRVSAIEMPRQGRFRVWVRWSFHFGDRTQEESHATVYFMASRPDGQLTIEMMDVVQLPSTQARATAQSA